MLAGTNLKVEPRAPGDGLDSFSHSFYSQPFRALMKILIVKLSSIGDVVHTLPALAAIKNAMPGAEVSWVVEKGAAEILRGNECLSSLIEIDTKALKRRGERRENLPGARRQLRELRASRFDIALDFQGLLKSAGIAKLSRSKRRFGFSRAGLREPAARFLLTDKIDVSPELHIIRKNLALAAGALSFNAPDAPFEFPIFTGAEHRTEAQAAARQAGGPFAILNPAGGWVTKLWSPENFGALADLLWEKHNLASIVTAGPGEQLIAERVLMASRSGKVTISTPSLKGFFELARMARVYVGGDTGPTHLAIAAKTPVVGIFGPTEWWRNGSTDPDDICVERADIGCRSDCHRRTCSNWICMNIDVNTLSAAVDSRLKKSEQAALKI
jgi:heptosyltransferase I